jgi:phosphotransferase system  glucose/maltose/N-acetylglucosamine-specific IIC component
MIGNGTTGERFGGKGTVVSATVAAFGIAVLVLIIGSLLGWHANRTYGAHGDVKTTRGRIAGYRKVRLRSGLWALAFAIIALLVLAALVRH